MATIKSQLRAAYANATSRNADVTQTMLDIFNLTGFIDGTNPNFTLRETGLTAGVGGTQANGIVLSPTVFVHQVNTVTSGNDSVLLPPSAGAVGQIHILINNAASNSMQVFGTGADTINNVVAATGVAHAAGLASAYFCPVAGLYFRILGG